MTGEELKEFIKSRGESYAEFAALVGVTQSSIATAVSSGKVSKQLAAACALVAENERLKDELKRCENLTSESALAPQIERMRELVKELANLQILQ